MKKQQENPETLECKDYYDVEIREGDRVIALSEIEEKIGKVKKIVLSENVKTITIRFSKNEILENANPKDYCVYELSKPDDYYRKKWIQKDMQDKKHIYTEYKDIDGINLAERMVLENAYEGQERRMYYVARNSEGKYYLQSFEDTSFPGAFDPITRKQDLSRIESRTQDMEYARNLEVVSCLNGKVLFLEDFGFKNSEFPKKIKVIDGKVFFEENNL